MNLEVEILINRSISRVDDYDLDLDEDDADPDNPSYVLAGTDVLKPVGIEVFSERVGLKTTSIALNLESIKVLLSYLVFPVQRTFREHCHVPLEQCSQWR